MKVFISVTPNMKNISSKFYLRKLLFELAGAKSYIDKICRNEVESNRLIEAVLSRDFEVCFTALKLIRARGILSLAALN